ncbi:MAG: amidohydrolase [Flavobacteriales bacterium]|nr:amidohydrolase [Flavobacteriales bacterium]|tara:strand:+ start:1909 stop:3042 length:1134 start_codon:yes stop_codon:yes gene_type:complete
MRYLTSDIIFTAFSSPIYDGVIVVDDDGKIADLLEDNQQIDSANLEYFRGALCPGFINTHCHLELSHLQGELAPKTGLPHFINSIGQIRKASQRRKDDALKLADRQMYNNGIVAVADISNTADSFSSKANSAIYYYTFIELFSSNPHKAEEVFERGLKLSELCNTPNSLTPHANYSVSLPLFEKIRHHNKGEIISIHSQETSEEDTMFLNGTGKLLSQLIAKEFFKYTGKTALQSTLPLLPESPILLVHNTFTKKEDMTEAISNFDKLYWCTCPKANLYIENQLPNYQQFIDAQVKMTIGTDSLASNDTLSILEEMKTIQSYVSLDLLMEWACKNGAEFLGLDALGTLKKGKIPGINYINHIIDGKLTDASQVKKLF